MFPNEELLILYKLFLVEKLFKSIQFQFSLEINKEVEKKYRLKDFRSDHCDNFSEQVLTYKVVENSFPKKNWIRISGENFKLKDYKTGEPDYYVRFKNKVFLFESKDVVLKGGEKQSRDYSIIKEALKDKFYWVKKKNKIKSKAILQLIENIKKILDKFYSQCDIDYKSDTIKIYPILIVHDRQYEALGVNKLLIKWFDEELAKIKNDYNISNIKNITVLNIDTMLFFQETLKQRGKSRLEKLIDDYHKANLNPTYFKSFDNFMQTTFDKKNLKLPNYVRNYATKIFENEE